MGACSWVVLSSFLRSLALIHAGVWVFKAWTKGTCLFTLIQTATTRVGIAASALFLKMQQLPAPPWFTMRLVLGHVPPGDRLELGWSAWATQLKVHECCEEVRLGDKAPRLAYQVSDGITRCLFLPGAAVPSRAVWATSPWAASCRYLLSYVADHTVQSPSTTWALC